MVPGEIGRGHRSALRLIGIAEPARRGTRSRAGRSSLAGGPRRECRHSERRATVRDGHGRHVRCRQRHRRRAYRFVATCARADRRGPAEATATPRWRRPPTPCLSRSGHPSSSARRRSRRRSRRGAGGDSSPGRSGVVSWATVVTLRAIDGTEMALTIPADGCRRTSCRIRRALSPHDSVRCSHHRSLSLGATTRSHQRCLRAGVQRRQDSSDSRTGTLSAMPSRSSGSSKGGTTREPGTWIQALVAIVEQMRTDRSLSDTARNLRACRHGDRRRGGR